MGCKTILDNQWRFYQDGVFKVSEGLRKESIGSIKGRSPLTRFRDQQKRYIRAG